ncbi:MAG: CNNM domain-containing protein [Planctomycetota bacterium]|nr:CNNM domain-containing protein [Planctomycetota bacterium]
MIAETADILNWALWPAVLAASVILYALYAGLETGVYTLNKIRLNLYAEQSRRSARLLHGMLAKPNNLLAVLLIGTNIPCYAATFAVSAIFVTAGYAHRAEWLTLIVATPILFVVGDSIPKGLFHRRAERLVYRLAWLLKASDVLFKLIGVSYLVRGLSWVIFHLAGAGGLRQQGLHEVPGGIVAEAHASGVLSQFQSVMAERVMQLADVTLVDVMIPMRDVVSARSNITLRQVTQLFADCNYSRVPLLDAGGRVVGVLDLYDVVAEAPTGPPANKMATPLCLPAETPVSDALYRMQRTGAAMAVVESAGGRHIGIATVKDLVEEIVGELKEW